jgi:ribA/ribD-fused uncharacterized protein
VNPAKQTWPTVEHYYQAMKFPQEPEWQEAIRTAPTAARAKKMGLDRGHAPRGDWDAIKEKVMKMALQAKFQQNPALLALLLGTGTKTLVFNSTGDAYWGATSATQGRNRLGFLLMDVRRALKESRVDQTLLEPAPTEAFVIQPNLTVANAEESADVAVPTATEVATATAAEAVSTVTGGIVQMQPAATGVQQGGVYLFINPGVQTEPRAKAARQRGGRPPITWTGAQQQQHQQQEQEQESQDGGDVGDAGPSSGTEYHVEKLG